MSLHAATHAITDHFRGTTKREKLYGRRLGYKGNFEKDLAKAAAENSVTVTGDLDGKDLTVTAVDLGRSTK